MGRKTYTLKLPNHMRILICLYRKNSLFVSEIAKNTGCTFSFTSFILNVLEEKKLITSKTDGRKKIIKLSQLGFYYGKYFSEWETEMVSGNFKNIL